MPSSATCPRRTSTWLTSTGQRFKRAEDKVGGCLSLGTRPPRTLTPASRAEFSMARLSQGPSGPRAASRPSRLASRRLQESPERNPGRRSKGTGTRRKTPRRSQRGVTTTMAMTRTGQHRSSDLELRKVLASSASLPSWRKYLLSNKLGERNSRRDDLRVAISSWSLVFFWRLFSWKSRR